MPHPQNVTFSQTQTNELTQNIHSFIPHGYVRVCMNRPLADTRPFGPFVEQEGGVAKIRVKYFYRTNQGATEATQSLERSIMGEVDEVRISNVTVMTGSEDFVMSVAADIDQKTFDGEEEDKLQMAIGRALIDAGVENIQEDGYQYTAVTR